MKDMEKTSMFGDLKEAGFCPYSCHSRQTQPNEKRYLSCPVHIGLFINVQHFGDQKIYISKQFSFVFKFIFHGAHHIHFLQLPIQLSH